MIEVTYLDHMGSDLTVVNAARVSFAKRSEWEKGGWEPGGDGWESYPQSLSKGDAKLLQYLAEHSHWTPFAHPQITLHVKAPIFVRTQCFKHKVGFVENEISRRYVDDNPEFFIPDAWRGRAENKKQGGGNVLNVEWARESDGVLKEAYAEARFAYDKLLKNGVAPEQARMVLPQSMLTEWHWTGSLAAYARFCKQRLGKDAQAETGDIARLASTIIEPLFPVSWSALMS